MKSLNHEGTSDRIICSIVHEEGNTLMNLSARHSRTMNKKNLQPWRRTTAKPAPRHYIIYSNVRRNSFSFCVWRQADILQTNTFINLLKSLRSHDWTAQNVFFPPLTHLSHNSFQLKVFIFLFIFYYRNNNNNKNMSFFGHPRWVLRVNDVKMSRNPDGRTLHGN